MTLCILWRSGSNIHLASDSRLTFSKTYVDVAIKVCSVPFKIYSPTDSETRKKELVHEGELGMCFAGSAINALFIKEAIVEILKNLQYAPGYTDVSMPKIAGIFFKAYKNISKQVCQSELFEKGIAEIFIAGHCPKEKKIKAYKFTTDPIKNIHNYFEILENEGDYILSGSGKKSAQALIDSYDEKITEVDFLKILKKVIDEKSEKEVGGNIQYGKFEGERFFTYGIVEYKEGDDYHKVKYWRGPLDLNSKDFEISNDDLILSYTYIDL